MSQDVALYNLRANEVVAAGYEDIKAKYTKLFKQSPHLHSKLKNRMVMGNKVIDHESITGRMGNDDIPELIVVYEVIEEKINRITIIRP